MISQQENKGRNWKKIATKAHKTKNELHIKIFLNLLILAELKIT
jgi:hypothetical protein